MTRVSMLWSPLAVFAALAHIVCADIEFTKPTAGQTLTGGSAIEIAWKDSGDEPAISDLTTYQIWICAGGNAKDERVDLLAITPNLATFAITGNSATATVGKGIGASTPKNAYFIKIVSTSKTGGTITNFSPRFSLSGMEGSFPAGRVADSLKILKGTDGPEKEDNLASGDTPVNPAAGDFGVEYNMQTGTIRYAPMIPPPQKSITKKNAERQHSTSSVQIATTRLPIPKQQTTVTQERTYTYESRENPATPAPNPQDDMQKFLNRWKD